MGGRGAPMVKKIAFLFPGQGSQFVGMGKMHADRLPECAKLFKDADSILGFPLSQIMWEGPEDKLKDTAVTQPALFVASAVALIELKNLGVSPDIVAGHSLGEYSALYAAGVISFVDALKLVASRGNSMKEAAQKTKGTMAAIIGLDAEKIEDICRHVGEEGEVCTPANFNSDTQIVVAGTKKGIVVAMEKAKEAGAMKTVELNVAGAFHSPLMSSAVKKMKPVIDICSFQDSKIPVITNVDAKLTTSGTEFKNKLVQQIDHPVRWNESAERMISEGTETFIEVGPGRVLSSLIKRMAREKNILWTDDLENIKKKFNLGPRSSLCV